MTERNFHVTCLFHGNVQSVIYVSNDTTTTTLFGTTYVITFAEINSHFIISPYYIGARQKQKDV